MTVVYIVLAVICFLILLTVAEVAVLLSQKPAQESPDDKDYDSYSLNVSGKSFEDLYLFLSGEKAEPSFDGDEVFALLKKQSDFMKKRFDCADFRAQMFFKIYKDCGAVLEERSKELIKNAFLDGKAFFIPLF